MEHNRLPGIQTTIPISINKSRRSIRNKQMNFLSLFFTDRIRNRTSTLDYLKGNFLLRRIPKDSHDGHVMQVACFLRKRFRTLIAHYIALRIKSHNLTVIQENIIPHHLTVQERIGIVYAMFPLITVKILDLAPAALLLPTNLTKFLISVRLSISTILTSLRLGRILVVNVGLCRHSLYRTNQT